jgi:hypothetical protein
MGSLRAQAAALEARLASLAAADLADAVLAHIHFRVAFAHMSEAAAFGTDLLAQLAAATASSTISDPGSAGDVWAVVAATQQRHQAAAARVPCDCAARTTAADWAGAAAPGTAVQRGCSSREG